MAHALRRSAPPLKGQLLGRHTSFDYYQLVRLLLRLRQVQAANREVEGGQESQATLLQRTLRFRGELSAAFPGHEISGWRNRGDDRPIEIDTPNFSIAGSLGPLPDPFAEWARDRAGQGDRAMGDFFDLFNNRLNALRFEIKSRLQPGLSTAEQPEQTPLAKNLAAILGSCDPDLPNPLPLPRRALLALTGLLADQRRSGTGLIRVLSPFLEAKVMLEPFKGGWFAIAREDQIRLGQRRHRLGIDTPLGSRAWDEHAGIGLTIGPLPRSRFEALLPGNSDHEGFKALLHFLTGRSVDCHIRLLTHPRDGHLRYRTTRLGRGAKLGSAPLVGGGKTPRLGYTAWLGTGHNLPDAPPAEVCFVIPAFEQGVAV